ncbi:carbamoyl phosphate synthase small subunit [Terribacillus saccharophilus]|uniref:carbamoyl phosphate synthase small subunit n=1 Tax=Terribacillus saccharophilus TaxID=361277 RepID=UPI000BA5D6E0|nr:carbamoyl phosphate synthase small subunit [Terribacillus saccharophilus]PAF20800.1 carbamoyl phosphate synthase small subunit [Terribacillus saccharophilus]PAF35808.1 carbamoyl phosphate synthase small subunit [Terribacillus saccharophilus]PAF36620.1 carbamoyl phosphate synthase small subunit [Terribacillus saccharophilus]
MEETKGYLMLSTGDILEGVWLGKTTESDGEMVFNTAMTGYQEVMTDPSYAGQIVTMTYPLIGNYGFNTHDKESHTPSIHGLVISTPCETPAHYQATQTLQDIANEHNFPILAQVDTRKLTKIIRKHGDVYGKMTKTPGAVPEKAKVSEKIVESVSVKKAQFHSAEGQSAAHVAIIDYGYKHSIRDMLLENKCDVTVFPFDTTLDELKKEKVDGVLLSNGPGDPKSLHYLTGEIKRIAEYYPTLGICLGHQLLALAFGGNTMRLPYGHRGSNHPVQHLPSGKVSITSQNHGYVVDEASISQSRWNILYSNVNDGSVEGLQHCSKPIMSVQFHPEAHPGPSDTYDVFEQFLNSVRNRGVTAYA